MIAPQVVVQELYHATQGNAFVTSDVGQHQTLLPNTITLINLKMDQLGWHHGFGLPAAMGVKLHFQNNRLYVLPEKAAFKCIQELSTCLQYNLPIKIININNEALGMVRQWQDTTMEEGTQQAHIQIHVRFSLSLRNLWTCRHESHQTISVEKT